MLTLWKSEVDRFLAIGNRIIFRDCRKKVMETGAGERLKWTSVDFPPSHLVAKSVSQSS